MAQEHPITRLGGWAGYEVVEDWQERRGGKSWCVLRLEAVTGWLRQCSHCGESTRAVHDQQERRIRELPIFEYRVELVVPRVRVACARCGPRLERLSWLEPYARAHQAPGRIGGAAVSRGLDPTRGQLLRTGLEDSQGLGDVSPKAGQF